MLSRAKRFMLRLFVIGKPAPPLRELSSKLSLDDARLLPRMRSPLLRAHHEKQAQYAAIDEADPKGQAKIGPKHILTKGGDPLMLRGIPAIGRNVSGEMAQTHPAKEFERRDMQRYRMKVRLGEAS